MYKIALVEKPVGTLRVLTFLHEFEKATMTDFITSGWNRRTIEQSLKRLMSLGLIEKTKISQFPRFKKEYGLTSSGVYVAKYAEMARDACRELGGLSFREALGFPKGCMRILVYLSRREWRGTSELLKETELSANQIYRCLSALEKEGFIVVERESIRKKVILSCGHAPRIGKLLMSFDALDGALERALLWQKEGQT